MEGCLYDHLHVLIGPYCHPVQPYEDKPTFSLSPVLGSRRGFGFIPGVSSQLFSFPAFHLFFCSDSYKSSLNGLADLKERKDRSFFSLNFFSSLDFGCRLSSLQFWFQSVRVYFLFLTKPILVFPFIAKKSLDLFPSYFYRRKFALSYCFLSRRLFVTKGIEYLQKWFCIFGS